MGPSQALSLQIRVMAMKGYSTLPRSPELVPHHQMRFNVISKTPLFWVSIQASSTNRAGLVRLDGISTIVGYLMSNLFLYILTILFQPIQFSISRQFSSI